MYNSIATMCGWYVGGVLITAKYENILSEYMSESSVDISLDPDWMITSLN